MARYIVYFPLGATVPQRIKYVDDATAPPDANDDAATLGVTVGSIFIDQTTGKVYICRDASTGAAVWMDLTGADLTGADLLVIMRPDVTDPPEPLLNADGSGWLYTMVPR